MCLRRVIEKGMRDLIKAELEVVKQWGMRIGIYILGMIVVSLGIVLCAKSGLGISPVSSFPYVMDSIVPISFGTHTMIFHLINILFQYIFKRKLMNIKVFLQIPIAILMGLLIDFIKIFINVDTSVILYQYIALCLSVFFTALGMVFMLNMDLVQNPPDGSVRLFSKMTGTEMGKVKLGYDVLMVVGSNIMSVMILGRFEGLGVATVVSVIFVGKVLTLLQRTIGVKVRSSKGGSL